MISSPESSRLAAYLASTGWEAVRSGENGVVWSRNGERSLLVPSPGLDEDDYEDIAQRAVLRLRDIEGRPPEAITRDIALAGRDTLLIRIAAATIAEGEVPIRFGPDAFQGAWELCTAAALAENDPRARFGSYRPEIVTDAINTLTFGQTLAGSYVISIRGPEAQQLSLADDPVPTFERRILARALAATSAAATVALSEPELDSGIEDGVSFEICSALTKLDPGGSNVAVDISALWAPGVPQPAVVKTAVHLRDADLSHIREVGEHLAHYEPVQTTVHGILTDVHVDTLGSDSGRVKLLASVEGRARPLHVDLQGADFERVRPLAGRASLTLEGRLEKSGRSWVLADPRLRQVEEVPE